MNPIKHTLPTLDWLPKTVSVLPVGTPVPPHPNPLPKGEGEPMAHSALQQRSRLATRERRCSLSLRERAGVRGKRPSTAPVRKFLFAIAVTWIGVACLSAVAAETKPVFLYSLYFQA